MSVIPTRDIQGKLNVMFIGAHPDDADIEFGGTALRYLQLGHTVTYVSMANGDVGHHILSGGALAQRRRAETQAVAKMLGITYIVLDNHDGELQATIENRKKVIQIIREAKADLIVTHRLNDYHADHRATSQLVQDAAYLICVPNIVPFTPRLEVNPVIVFHQDHFSKPTVFSPDVIVDVTDVIDRKMEVLSCHESQVYEWLPFIEGYLDQVPQDKDKRLPWLKEVWGNPEGVEQFIPLLAGKLSAETFSRVKHIEAFERSEYGGALTHENVGTLFPFGITTF